MSNVFKGIIIAVLMILSTVLMGMNVFQDRVIQKQRELLWEMIMQPCQSQPQQDFSPNGDRLDKTYARSSRI